MPDQSLPKAVTGQLSKLLTDAVSFLKLLMRRFIADQGLPNAASLTYTTLLSLVPLTAVSLAVFAAFPISDRLAEQAQNFIFNNFVPTSGQVVQRYLLEFSQNASKMTGAGFVFLIVVALMMMANIDASINMIWRAGRKRRPLYLFMTYWAILTLGPLLIGMSVVATSYLVSLPFISGAANGALSLRLLSLMPFILSAVAFTLLYLIVPNRRVPLRHGVAGGLVAAFLFEFAKQGFVFYVTRFPTYQAIYGALAFIPIFLIWIYVSWVVTLLGAEFTYCLGVVRDRYCKDVFGRGSEFLLAYRMLEKLWEAQQQGQALSLGVLSNQLDDVSEERLEVLLMYLQKASLVLRTREGGWALARDLSSVRLMDLYRSHEFVLPGTAALGGLDSSSEQALVKLLKTLESEMQGTLSTSLKSLYTDHRGR
ncbi:MAG: virulence factor BrkB family protein [Gammaproteobacteria bacterium]|nr:virulence factor BrkB family protein [Gammaproteobacteria bacterium]